MGDVGQEVEEIAARTKPVLSDSAYFTVSFAASRIWDLSNH